MKKALAVLLLSVFPAVAHATYTCTGAVNDLVVSPNGVLTTTVGSLANVYLCQIGATYNGITSDVCKAIYAHLLTAKTTGKQELFQFSDALTCTTHPAWAPLTGWYFGPNFQ